MPSVTILIASKHEFNSKEYEDGVTREYSNIVLDDVVRGVKVIGSSY